MFAILGAAGKIGYATCNALRRADMPVRAILREAAKSERLRAIGCDVAQADVQDPAALVRAIAGAQTVQIIVPPQPQAEDMAADLRQTMHALVKALEEVRPALVLLISDYGAHLGEGNGIPSLFFELEERLRQLSARKIFLRSAEHMENWGRSIPTAVATGILPSLIGPMNRQFPTVAARDVGLAAAELLLRPDVEAAEEIVHVEGPRRYSVADVAEAISKLLDRTVTADVTPRSEWEVRLQRVMPGAVNLMIELYDVRNRGFIDVELNAGEIRYGKTELIDALRPLVATGSQF
jgi:uncharacterized protein YbjT (DUF2867 family)